MGSMGKSAFIIHHFLSCHRPPSTPYCLNECIYSWTFCPIWPHGGGKVHQYMAVGAAALLIQDCLRGKGTPGWSRIMVLRPQWLPPPLPPTCHPLPLLPLLPAMPSAAAATVAPPQIDLSDSNSYSSADDNSGSCKIVESVGNKGKTSYVCLSGDVHCIMFDKVKVNARRGIQTCHLLRSQ